MKALRHRIDILQESKTVDDDGHEVKQWVTLKSIWANMIPQSNREEEVGGVMKRTECYTVESWYYSDITHDHRIRYKGKDYQIEEIINVGECNKHMTMNCARRS